MNRRIAGVNASPQNVYSRAQGAFLGMAIGDALGATTEFMTLSEIRDRYGVHEKMVGGGWLHLKPGQVTDDTQMSLCIARALCLTGHWDLHEIAEQFAAWLRSSPADVGATCRRGIRDYAATGSLEVPEDRWHAGNGALMRMVAPAIFTLGNDVLLVRSALEQAHLTHNHYLSDAACVVAGRMVHGAVMAGQRAPLSSIAREFVDVFPEFSFNPYRGRASGYVVDTVQTVFHFLFTTGTFEDCLVGVVNQGGDADTNGAVAGMIAGAFYGLAEIPERWIKRLDPDIREMVLEYAVRLLRLSPWSRLPQPNTTPS